LLLLVVSLVGLHFFSRFVPVETRRDNSDSLAMVLGVVGTMYALLLGFIAIAAWESFGNAEKTVVQEADVISVLYRNTSGLPNADAEKIRGFLREYSNIVIKVEWTAQMNGDEIPYKQSHAALQGLHAAVIAIDASSNSMTTVQSTLLQSLNQLYVARRDRYMAARCESGIPEVIWIVVFLGTALTIGTSLLLGHSSLRMHRALVSILVCAIGLILVLVIALDRPFRGELSISKAPYEFNMKVFE